MSWKHHIKRCRIVSILYEGSQNCKYIHNLTVNLLIPCLLKKTTSNTYTINSLVFDTKMYVSMPSKYLNIFLKLAGKISDVFRSSDIQKNAVLRHCSLWNGEWYAPRWPSSCSLLHYEFSETILSHNVGKYQVSIRG